MEGKKKLIENRGRKYQSNGEGKTRQECSKVLLVTRVEGGKDVGHERGTYTKEGER